MPQAVCPGVTHGQAQCCQNRESQREHASNADQEVRKHNHSRLTGQPLVTDHNSTTVEGIFLSHETSYVHQAHAIYFNRAWQQDPFYARVSEATS